MLLSIGLFFGRLHPLLVHLPIGILLMGLFLQVLSRWPRFGIPARVVTVVMLCGALSAVASCVTGYLLSLSGDYDDDLVNWHMWMGIWVAVVSVVLFLMSVRRMGGAVFGVTGGVLLVLVFVTGHLGGSLTHGSDYLSSAFDEGVGSAAVVRKPIADIREARVYGDVIQPMLQLHCYGCHGPARQKGKLRLDDSVWIVKGGKDGAVVRAFHAEESELIKRMLLAPEDEHRMPPKDRTPLKESEIALFKWWVEQGADFSKKVREFPLPGKIAGYLAALQGSGTGGEDGGSALVPDGVVEAAAEKDIDALRAKKVIVVPVAAGSHWLSVNFLNAVDVSDLTLLLPLRKQLVWLKLGGQPVGDSGMAVVGQCAALTVLHLNDTRVDDKGLVALRSLHGLRLLNLVGTGVTAAGVVGLDSLKRLERVYLYRTAVTSGDWVSLRRHFPKTVLDSGGYRVPFAARDTVDELRLHNKLKTK